jgi:hypothetical protein
MSCPQVAGGEDASKFGGEVANILNKQSQTVNKVWYSNLGVGWKVKTHHNKN